MTEFPIIEGKRFWPFRLNELVDKWSHEVNEASEELPEEPKPIADFVIENHTYPMHHGRPDDLHKLNCFHGDWCKSVDRDFWQYPQETLTFGIGDCEDVSILATALIGKVLNANQVYEVLGVVKDADSGRILGGHGWTYAKYGKVGGTYTKGRGEWHYLEMTRQNAPSKYPVVPDIREPYVHKNWKLVPYVLLNWKKFEEIKGGLVHQKLSDSELGAVDNPALEEYLRYQFEEKETREKYEALAEINDDPMQPLAQKEEESTLSKIIQFFKREW